MKLLRLLTLSATPCVAWALTTGCGSGGGFAGGWGEGNTSGSSGAGVAGATAGSGAGTGGSAQGAEGGAADIDSGGAGNLGGQDGTLGGQAGAASGAGFGGVGGTSAGLAGGGTAGGAGGGGNGAASGAGGFAGTAGNGGASGNSGASGAETAGSGGASAMGGMGAMSGLGGASGSSVGGSAGKGGSAGTGGTGGPLRTCAERCNTNADCRIFSVDAGYRCNTGTHRCERFAEPCRSSAECVPAASVWIFACRSDLDCFFFSDDLCVDVGGVGRCARRAPSANGCADPNPDELTLPRFGTGGNALVCANTSRTCSEGECVPGCASNADCSPAQNGSVCDLGTRLCRCVRDQDCGGPGVSRCNTASGRCECASADDCNDVSNANVCAAGRCGCSNVSACNDARTFAGTSYACE